MNYSDSIVILYKDERGFWGADLYLDCAELDINALSAMIDDGMVPDGFFTRSVGGTLLDVFTEARRQFPGARIELGSEESEEEE